MSMKNMAVMFGAMALLRRIDQEEPQVVQYARMAYMGYVVVVTTVYLLLHLRITRRRDTTLITVPVARKPRSLTDALASAKGDAAEEEKEEGGDDGAEGDGAKDAAKKGPGKKDGKRAKKDGGKKKKEGGEKADDGGDNAEAEKAEDDSPKEEVITVMEYDLRHLATMRKSWLTNACLLTAIHYKMESVSPLVMSSLNGLVRLLTDDPLVQLHLRGAPAVGPLKRPFTPEKSPLSTLLKEMVPKPEEKEDDSAEPAEDLHDDGDSDDEYGPAPTIDDLKDDHIKGDFDEDDDKGGEATDAVTKKSQ